MSEQASVRLFLDRSTNSKRFAAAVREMVTDVVTIGDRYGIKAAEKVSDTTWLSDASAEGRICVGADGKILYNPLERRAICVHAARYVVFSNNNMPSATTIKLFREHLPKIAALKDRAGPWVFKIAPHGMYEAKLDCPKWLELPGTRE
ncbi:hypothetical protein [Embleya sp. NPDC020630]|uniref:PIN-like domain-containing protein n=1 Tax=Embleya sp. NPDC020630 TaxID=3363979 RepID=UPI0037BB01C5